MRRFVPRLHIAIISTCEKTAFALAERIYEHGQLAHIFANAKDLCERAELQALDIVFFDRRSSGFAMSLSAVRSLIRDASGYAVLCGFGVGWGLTPIGLDYSYDSAVSDADLRSLLADAMSGLDDASCGHQESYLSFEC
ncbi:hypothetical protein ABT364_11840 [Massilia sp. SR12]